MPIFSAIGTAIAGALFAGSTLAATLISSALAFGTRLAMSYLNRPKKRKYSAVQGEVQYGADVPVGALYGIGKVKGHRVFYGKWGKGNKFNGDVYILSNGWCDGLEGLFFYGEKQTLVPVAPIGGEVARYETENFGNNLTIRFYDGRPGQPVDAKLVNDTKDLGRKWNATSVCAGQCYVVIEREYDSRFEKGTPEFEFVLRGLRLYDPRKDSTVAGGSGTQRQNDSSTWQLSRNPAVQRLNYQLGLKGLISGRTLIGEGKTMGQIDLSSYFAAMNVSDTVKNGKPTYQSAIYVQGDDDHTEVLKEFDDAMAGYGLNRRGLSGVIPGAPQIPVLEITAADIPVDRAQEVSLRKSAFDMYNMMSGQFTSEESQWGSESLKPIVVNQDIADDGRRRQTANDFLQVSDPDIAQYLLNIRYRQNRKGGQATVPVSRRVGLKVQEGEWVTYQGKSWLVTEWRCDERFQFTLVLSETGADIYSDGDIEPGPIIIPPSPPINPSVITTIQGFAAEVGVIDGAAGYKKPALRFAWTPPNDPTITEVQFVYRIAGTFDEFEDKSTNPEKGLFITSKDVQSGVYYEARATITTRPDRFRTYTPWITTALKTGLEAILPGGGDTTPPGVPTNLEAFPGVMFVLLEWIDPADADLDHIEAFMSSDTNINNAKLAQSAQAGAGSMVVPGISDEAPRYFWVRAVDTSGNKSGFTSMVTASATVIGPDQLIDGAVTQGKIADAAIGADQLMDEAVTNIKLADEAVTAVKLATGSVLADKIADQAITNAKLANATIEATKFASGIKPVEILAALPTTGLVEGRQVYLTTDKKLYRYNGTAWTAAVAAVDLDGQITGTQISDNAISAPKIAANAITAGKIAANAVTANTIAANAVTAGKIAAGAVSAEQIAAGAIIAGKIGAEAVTADNIAAKTITASKLYIGDTSNMYPDPEFADLTNPTGGYTINGSMVSGANASASPAARWLIISNTNGNTNVRAIGPAIPVDQNTTYYASAYWGLSGAEGGTAQLALVPYADAAGTITLSGSVTIAINSTIADRDVLKGTLFTTVAGAKSYRFHFIRPPSTSSSAAVFSFPYMRRAASAELIVDGAITAVKIGVNAVTAEKVLAGSITGEKIAASSITGDKIVANSITGREMILTDYTNLLQAPAMDDVNGWIASNGASLSVSNSGYNSPMVGVIRTSSVLTNVNNTIKVSEGDELMLVGVARRVSATAGSMSLILRYFDKSGALMASPLVSWVSSDTTYVRKTLNSTVPAGAYYCRVDWGGSSGIPADQSFFAGYAGLFRRSNAELIVDGAITAVKVAANAITADKIAANAVTADKIAANSVTAAKINVANLAAISATLGAVNIGNAIIGNLIVGTSNLDFRAVTASGGGSGTIEVPRGNSNGWYDIFSVTINNPNGNPVMFDIGYDIVASPLTDGTSNPRLRIIHQASGLTVWERAFRFVSGSSSGVHQIDSNFKMFRSTTQGNETYVYQVNKDQSQTWINEASGSMDMTWWKR
jgi:hypothetical protein